MGGSSASDASEAPAEKRRKLDGEDEGGVVVPRAPSTRYERVKRGDVLVRRYEEEAGTVAGCAGHALALTLARREAEALPGLVVVELGSSDGCAGLTAAKLGAAKVLFTDVHAEAMASLVVDAAVNGVGGTTQVLDYEWGAALPRTLAAHKVGLVLAADVLNTPWDGTCVGVTLDLLAANSPGLRALIAVSKFGGAMEEENLRAIEERGWKRANVAVHADDAAAVAGEATIVEFTKK